MILFFQACSEKGATGDSARARPSMPSMPRMSALLSLTSLCQCVVIQIDRSQLT